MRKTRLLLLSILTGLAPFLAHAENVSPYDLTFDALAVSTNSDGVISDPTFTPASGWDHHVETYLNWNSQPTNINWTYSSTDGVNDTPCLSVESQNKYDYNTSSYSDLKDGLITPPLTGSVTIQVKKKNSWDDSSIKFYKVTGSTGALTLGDEITANVPELSSSSWSTVTLTVDAGTRIAIVPSSVYIDNFHADNADITKQKKLTVKSITNNSGSTVDADADGNYKLNIDVTLLNNGDYNLTANEEGDKYSIDLVNATADNTVVATAKIPEDLAVNATSSTINLTANLNISNYPSTGDYFVRENVTNSTKDVGDITPLKYEPIVTLVQNVNSYTTKDVDAATTIDFGKSQKDVVKNFTISNSGAAALKINKITLPEGFETTLTAGNIDAHQSKDFTITMKASVAGKKSGTVTIVPDNAPEFSFSVNGTVVDSTAWFVDFEDGKVPVDVTLENDANDQSWKVGYLSTSTYPGNNYCAQRSSSVPAKFISPLLLVSDGDVLSFDAKRDNTQSDLKIYYSKDKKNWTLAKEFEDTEFSSENISQNEWDTAYPFAAFTVDNIPAGIYYIAFEAGGVDIDNIEGYKVVAVKHSLSLASSDIPANGEINSKYTAKVTIKNVNRKDETADSYNAKLHFGDDVIGVASKAIKSGEEANFEFTTTPHATGTYKTFVEFSDGSYVLTSDTVDVNVIAEQAVSTAQVGTKNASYFGNAPVVAGSGRGESQTVYPASALAESGIAKGSKITKVFYKGNFSYGSDFDLIASAWIGNVANTELTTDAPLSTDNLTKIVDAKTFTIKNQGTDADNPYTYIEFDIPEGFIYDGTNIGIVVQTQATGSNSTIRYIYTAADKTAGRCIYRSNYDANEDLSTETWRTASAFPVTFFNVEATAKEVTGMVTADGTGVADANVTFTSGNVIYATKTDANGAYSLSVIKDQLTYNARIFKAGYNPAKENDIAITEGLVKNYELQKANGLYVESTSIPESGEVNSQYTATAKVLNAETKDYSASDYTATLYFDNDSVATATSTDIKSGSNADFTFTFYPHKSGTYKAHVEFANVGSTVKTASEPVDVTIAEETASKTIQIGDSINSSTSSPANLYAGAISESETMYNKNEIGFDAGSVIKSITYKADVNSYTPSVVPVTFRVYIENTTDELSDGDFTATDTTTMTKVFDGIINVDVPSAATQRLFTFPIEDGFKYTGDNLRIYVVADPNEKSFTARFAADETENSYARNIQAWDGEFGPWSKVNTPVVWFDIVNEYTISGTIVNGPISDTDTTPTTPIAGATVKLVSDGIEYYGTTDEDGNYSISVAKPGLTYTVTIEADGYESDTINNVTFADGDITLNDTLYTHAQTTGIDNINSSRNVKSGKKGIYTIDGKFIGKDIDIKSLPNGLYIIDGRKRVIK